MPAYGSTSRRFARMYAARCSRSFVCTHGMQKPPVRAAVAARMVRVQPEDLQATRRLMEAIVSFIAVTRFSEFSKLRTVSDALILRRMSLLANTRMHDYTQG